MKKRKLDLSKEGLKQLALAHGEKAAFGAGLLIFAIFVYAFFGRVTLPVEKGPDELKRRAQEAQSHMAASQWDEKRENLAITNYVIRAKRDPLVPEEYALKTPFDMPPRPQLSKRSDPALLAVESLEAVGGQSAFELKAAGETEVHGQRWAMITGLVPVRKQTAAYDEVFKDAIPIAEARPNDATRDDSPRDAPVYRRQPTVERAEVVDGQESKLDWKPIDMVKIVTMKERWANKTPEIVSARFVDPVYTKELGPLASGSWVRKRRTCPRFRWPPRPRKRSKKRATRKRRSGVRKNENGSLEKGPRAPRAAETARRPERRASTRVSPSERASSTGSSAFWTSRSSRINATVTECS